MNRTERDEIETLPYKYRPVGAWGYFGYTILFNLPFIGFIFLIVFAVSSGNINRRSFARSYFCGAIIVGIIVAIAVALLIVSGQLDAVINAIRNIIPSN